MRAALYARVSQPSTQATEDKVSIDQQLANMRELCERNGWQIAGEFVDNENYKATQNPKRGKIVNPSGERADRPQFLAMLEVVKTGDVDVVLCWRDDRLVRHPRVAVALEDALDIGDTRRNGRPKTEIRDATGATIDRFTLSIKATIWREENKRRAERTQMGKVATLQQGRWPGHFKAFGYTTRREQEKRGRIIEIAEQEAAWVRKVCGWYNDDVPTREIRRRLIAEGVEQSEAGNEKKQLCYSAQELQRHDWGLGLIYQILRAEFYTGRLTWNFGDGTEIAIEIPAIIPRHIWEQNKARLERNKQLSTRNAKGVYLLQGLVYCGDCGRAMAVGRSRYWRYENGKRTERKSVDYIYRCPTPMEYPEESHPRPYNRGGKTLDWLVWRRVVDYGIKRPELIREEVLARQTELQAQGDSVDGDVAHACRRLAEVTQERKTYHKQVARGKMSEREYDELIDETEETRQYWQSELARLRELRDDAAKVEAGLDYVTELLTTLQAKLPEIDQTPAELRGLPEGERNEILQTRRSIVRALVDKVEVSASGEVKIHGLVDGSEAAQFELGAS